MHKLQEEQFVKQNKYSKFILALLILTVGILSVVRVFAANHLVETSENLRNLDNQVRDLETKNMVLAENVRVYESINYISTKITDLGFKISPRYSYLIGSPQVAFKNEIRF